MTDIFITGATGFVGRNFLEYVLRVQPEAHVTCLVRNPDKAQAQWPKPPANLRWLAGDLLEPHTYDTALMQAERVFHLAALVSLKNGPEFYTHNTQATQKLLEALSYSECLKRLVFLGSISAVDRPLNKPAVGPLTEESTPHPNTDYGKSKLMAEQLVMTSGLPAVSLRPSYIYGPHPRINSSMDRLIHDVQNQRHYTRFPFPGRTSEVYVEDLAEMIWLAGEHPAVENEVFFVGNPEPVVIRDVFPALAKALEIPYRPMTIGQDKLLRFQRSLYRQFPENLMLRILFEDYFYCSAEKWYRLTGYKPRFGHVEGLRKTVHWYREAGLLPVCEKTTRNIF